MKRVIAVFFVVGLAACTQGVIEAVSSAQEQVQPATASEAGLARSALPPEVDLRSAETFVRLGYAIDRTQRFQSTYFLTPRLRTGQASHLIRMVKSYNEFDGEKVAQALRAFEGRVSGAEFGREDSPVIYVDLPYWTHQREGDMSPGPGVRISDQDNDKLVAELRSVFVGQLKADEFSVQRRRVRVWWD